MERTKLSPLQLILAVLPLIALVLTAMVLGVLLLQDDVVITGSRSDESYLAIPDCVPTQVPREGAPLGIVEVYQPDVHQLTDTCIDLVFYTFNQHVTVFLGDEVLYRLTPADQSLPVRATGGTWVAVPLYLTDEGRTLRIEITPIYESVRGQRVEFLLGHSHSIFTDLFQKTLPELIVSVVLIAMGITVLLAAVIWRDRISFSEVILPLGLAGIFLALWRLTDSRFITFSNPFSSVFLYYTSLLSLGFTAYFLAKFLRSHYKPFLATRPVLRGLYNGLEILICLTILGQLALQLLGIRDLRETLMATHLMLVLVILLLIFTTVWALIVQRRDASRRFSGIHILLLALGLGADLLLFYIRRDSSSLLFTMLSLVVLILVRAVLFLKHYMAQEKTISDNQHQLINGRITLMLSQIRSHFIFNILNAISGMCKYDPERADRTVVAFARYLRTNINIMQEDNPVPFRAALEHVEDYVALEQIRFGDHIRFETDLEVEDFLIPPLLMQPLVENAIRHGLHPRPEGGTITLRTRTDGSFIRVDVADDGVGFDPENSGTDQSVGMQNVRFRLEHMVGGHVTVTSAPGEGTTVSLYIPRKENEA